MDILTEKIESFRKYERTGRSLSEVKYHEKNATDQNNRHIHVPVCPGLLRRRQAGL
ncbi:MAG: hypothetical protein PHD57_13020 [Desulfobacterales bacterium]|nr:hypothetical protein [Desulfobacterales bacterium]MDD3950465.1 hypothetical protein [Desulfobacterales bacterium]